jgi:NAD(P)-dependent dehydrogenase (short-subunit alcohol dehydrogenase family)
VHTQHVYRPATGARSVWRGTGHSTPLLDLDLGTWREVLATDLDGAFLCLQRAARRMVAAGRGGRIVNITSVHEHQPRVGAAAYGAAKAASAC